MNSNEDKFDPSLLYPLDYTHEQIESLLDKINDGEVLTKEQYRKLIHDIGLDNISTFDLDYNNLKNTPAHPVRLSSFINDSGYAKQIDVSEELLKLKSYVEEELDKVVDLWEGLRVLDIEALTASVNKAESDVAALTSLVDNCNQTIFSVERITEAIEDNSEELIREFNLIRNMQERDEYRLDNVNNFLTTHTEDIQSLLHFYETEKNKLSNTINNLNELQKSVDHLKEYNGIMHNIDLRVSKIEEFIKLLNPSEINLETSLTLIQKSIKVLQEKDKDFQLFHEDISQQIDELIRKLHCSISEIKSLKKRLSIDESWREETKQLLITIQNNISINSNEIVKINNILKNIDDVLTGINNDLKRIDDILISINNDLKRIDDEILKIKNDLKRIDSEILRILSITTNLENHCKKNEENIKKVDEAVEKLNKRMDASEENFLILQSRVSKVEDDIKTLATKEALNSINMQMHFNEQGYAVIELFLEGNKVSSITIPHNVRPTDRIARTNSAITKYSVVACKFARTDLGITDYSIVADDVETEDRIAKTDSGKTDYSKTI